MTAGRSGWRFADGMTPTPRQPEIEDSAAEPAEADQPLTTETI